ncbi:phosphonate metabolism transcriptional regulator PhnF [Rhizobium alvei]|uniref:Phosphonate metabolism transcriptional regulator PhnF n=1 Tax=Rhizobium alvei TaxID=1132659 RepID=A0ABT8YRH3_9HYPH|nr:phosphonate metabolism transcriptional regulator PhnF [Rhizobium alvei]MDO6965755.1 phosphonate metabolism transcriptional regulator PhnF [Rhizobium alvei]
MTQTYAIDRRSGISAWRQIADQISRSIASGEYDARGMVPPEAELAEKFGVNRHTVRSAIATLAEEGLLQPVRGRGTLIAKRERLVLPVSRRTRFSSGLGEQSGDVVIRLLSSETVLPEEEVRRALRLGESEKVVMAKTLGLARDMPISFATSFFPAERFPNMADSIRATGSVTRAFAMNGLADYVRVSTEVIGRLATSEEAEQLNLSNSAVVLETISINADLDGNPVQFARTIFAGDRISLRLETAQG